MRISRPFVKKAAHYGCVEVEGSMHAQMGHTLFYTYNVHNPQKFLEREMTKSTLIIL